MFNIQKLYKMETTNKKRNRVWRPALHKSSSLKYEQVKSEKKYITVTGKKDPLAFVVDWQLPKK